MSTRIDQFSSPAAAGGGSGTDEVNVWIVGDDEEVIVIDPGTDTAGVLDLVGDREVLAVICTHGHADHVAAAIELAERDEAPVALHPKDRMLWREA
ncbi:MAG: MBL fold metallo-hydrolase, partial [Streptosporangiaceae bacterium]